MYDFKRTAQLSPATARYNSNTNNSNAGVSGGGGGGVRGDVYGADPSSRNSYGGQGNYPHAEQQDPVAEASQPALGNNFYSNQHSGTHEEQLQQQRQTRREKQVLDLYHPPPEAQEGEGEEQDATAAPVTTRDVLRFYRGFMENFVYAPPRSWRRVRFDLPASIVELRLTPPTPLTAPGRRARSTIQSPTVVLEVEGRIPEDTSVDAYIRDMINYMFDLLTYLNSPVAITQIQAVKKGARELSQLVFTFANDTNLAQKVMEELGKAGIDCFPGPPLPNNQYAEQERGEYPEPVATFMVQDYNLNMHRNDPDDDNDNDKRKEDAEEDNPGGRYHGITHEDIELLLSPFTANSRQEGDVVVPFNSKTNTMNIIDGLREGLFYVALAKPVTVFTALWNPFASFLFQRDLFKRLGVLITMADSTDVFLEKPTPSGAEDWKKQQQQQPLQRDATGRGTGGAPKESGGGDGLFDMEDDSYQAREIAMRKVDLFRDSGKEDLDDLDLLFNDDKQKQEQQQPQEEQQQHGFPTIENELPAEQQYYPEIVGEETRGPMGIESGGAVDVAGVDPAYYPPPNTMDANYNFYYNNNNNNNSSSGAMGTQLMQPTMNYGQNFYQNNSNSGGDVNNYYGSMAGYYPNANNVQPYYPNNAYNTSFNKYYSSGVADAHNGNNMYAGAGAGVIGDESEPELMSLPVVGGFVEELERRVKKAFPQYEPQKNAGSAPPAMEVFEEFELNTSPAADAEGSAVVIPPPETPAMKSLLAFMERDVTRYYLVQLLLYQENGDKNDMWKYTLQQKIVSLLTFFLSEGKSGKNRSDGVVGLSSNSWKWVKGEGEDENESYLPSLLPYLLSAPGKSQAKGDDTAMGKRKRRGQAGEDTNATEDEKQGAMKGIKIDFSVTEPGEVAAGDGNTGGDDNDDNDNDDDASQDDVGEAEIEILAALAKYRSKDSNHHVGLMLSRYMMYFLTPSSFFSSSAGGAGHNSLGEGEEEEGDDDDDGSSRSVLTTLVLLPFIQANTEATNALVTRVLAHWPSLAEWLQRIIFGTAAGGNRGGSNSSGDRTSPYQKQLLSSLGNQLETLIRALSPAHVLTCRQFSDRKKFLAMYFANHSTEVFWSALGHASRTVLRLYINADIIDCDALIKLLFTPRDDDKKSFHEAHYKDYYYFVLAVASQNKRSGAAAAAEISVGIEAAKLCGFFLRWMEVVNKQSGSSAGEAVFTSQEMTQLAQTIKEAASRNMQQGTLWGYYFHFSDSTFLSSSSSSRVPHDKDIMTLLQSNPAIASGEGIISGGGDNYYYYNSASTDPNANNSGNNYYYNNNNNSFIQPPPPLMGYNNNINNYYGGGDAGSLMFGGNNYPSVFDDQQQQQQQQQALLALPEAQGEKPPSDKKEEVNDEGFVGNTTNASSPLYHKWTKAYTLQMASYPTSGEPFTPLPPQWSASLSRSYGHYYFKQAPTGADGHGRVTYKHPFDLAQFMATPQAFLLEHLELYGKQAGGAAAGENRPRSLEELLQYANDNIIAKENELADTAETPISPVTMSEAEAWLANQQTRNIYLDVAVLTLLNITYKSGNVNRNNNNNNNNNSNSKNNNSGEVKSTAKPPAAPATEAASRSSNFFKLIEDLQVKLSGFSKYPPTGPPFPPIKHKDEWKVVLGARTGRYNFFPVKPTERIHNSNRHPDTNRFYKASPQAFALDRSVPASRIAHFTHRLALPPVTESVERERRRRQLIADGVPPEKVEGHIRYQAVNMRTEEETQAWLDNQTIRDPALDAAIVKMFNIQYDYNDDFGGSSNGGGAGAEGRGRGEDRKRGREEREDDRGHGGRRRRGRH